MKCVAILTLVFGATSHAAIVDSLVLISQTSGQYDYAIQLAPNHGLVFVSSDQITLTGLSGVTGASALPGLASCFSIAAVTATSATFTDTVTCVFDPVPIGVTIGTLRVLSTVLTAGPVAYQIQTGNEGTLSGTVVGPVVTPEPGTGTLTVALIGLILTRALKPSL